MAILFRSTPAATARWRPLLGELLPEHEIRFWPEIGDRRRSSMRWSGTRSRGCSPSLPNLKLIFGLGAGIDHLLRDPDLPRHVPIVRLVDPYMTDAMSEYVALSVLRLHRQDLDYLAQQRDGGVAEREQKNAAERPVGILGFGTLGQDAGRKLQALGFPMSPAGAAAKRSIAGFRDLRRRGRARRVCWRRSEILVCLLPLTPETRGILNASYFRPDAIRGGDRQCRARRPSRRADLLPSARQRAGVGGGARRVRRRAAAAGSIRSGATRGSS